MKKLNLYGLECVSSRPLPYTAAGVVINCPPCTCFRRVTRQRRTTQSSRARSVALHVNNNGSGFKTTNKTSLMMSSSKLDYSELDDGGPPRWVSPLESRSRSSGSPLLLFLPGIDGVGFDLMPQHKRLGEIFDIRCLRIPLTDRTPMADLVMLVQSTVRSEHDMATKRPIYLVGESFGASLALIVASQNPDIDLVLILANPAASLSKSLLQSIVPFSDMIHKHMFHGMIPLPVETNTILWKLRMIHEMQTYLASHLHAIQAQTLILTSGSDILLSSIIEHETLSTKLRRCEVRSFIGNGNPLFLDETFDLVATIKRVSYYRRGESIDYVSDYIPPTPSELKMILEPFRWMDVALSPAIISTTENGELVRGFGGIPSEGPVLLVGNHTMTMGLDAILLVSRLWIDENIMVRGMAHPLIFERLKKGILPDLPMFDVFKALGAVPVSATNLYRGLSMKSHVLLYPGGAREAFHHKGEAHKLFWPVEPEFVRMAARFGAKIIPFGVVGEDDFFELLLDAEDQMKIPPLKTIIEELNSETIRLRSDVEGEVGKQLIYYPALLPKLPGRIYFLFGKPILMEGRPDILRNKDKANEMYLEIQNEVQKCISYLKEKREKDPYRNLLARIAYQSFNGFDSQVPTFDI